ncbi:MAG: hypothetical protein GC191_07045 [Azospirillum sp.]|nr:hypothetical protein [Azospirillum sp.]
MKTAVILVAGVLLQAAGNLCLSLGMKQWYAAWAGRGDLWNAVVLAAGIPTLWLGTGLLIAFTVLFMAVLSWAELSFVLPVVAIEVVINVVAAAWLLGETVSPLRWAGTVLVAAGVGLVAGTASSGATA